MTNYTNLSFLAISNRQIKFEPYSYIVYVISYIAILHAYQKLATIRVSYISLAEFCVCSKF